MNSILDFPIRVFVLTLVLLWLSEQLGDIFRARLRPLEEAERHHLEIVLPATLTLLGLMIGFSFSMVVSRYDQRKDYEEAEANAIGTEYIRAGLLPAAEAARVHELLKTYVDKRVLFYETRDVHQLALIDMQTTQLQTDLWLVVQEAAAKQPLPTVALAVSGMNDVLNSQGYTQAAWRNRLPTTAWCLLAAIAVISNLLIGYDSRRRGALFLIFPLAVSISFFLIADIDSPRRGLIHVIPQNLVSLSHSLQPQSAKPFIHQ